MKKNLPEIYTPRKIFSIDFPDRKGEYDKADETDKAACIVASAHYSWNYMKTLSDIYIKENKVTFAASKQCLRLNEAERLIYIRNIGAPKMSSDNPVLFYYDQAGCDSSSSSQEISIEEKERLFSQLSEDVKYDCYRRQIEAFESFLEAERRWKEQQSNKLMLFIYENETKKLFSKNRWASQRFKKKKLIVVVQDDFSLHHLKPVVFPPVTMKELLGKLKGDDFVEAGVVTYIRDMHPLVRDALLKLLDHLKKEFVKKIFHDLSKQSLYDQKMFVGLQRKTFIHKFFNEDIFEELYPMAKFPVICKTDEESSCDEESPVNDNSNDTNTIENPRKQDMSIEETHIELELEVPDDFDPFLAIRDSLRENLQRLVDFNLDSDSDST